MSLLQEVENEIQLIEEQWEKRREKQKAKEKPTITKKHLKTLQEKTETQDLIREFNLLTFCTFNENTKEGEKYLGYILKDISINRFKKSTNEEKKEIKNILLSFIHSFDEIEDYEYFFPDHIKPFNERVRCLLKGDVEDYYFVSKEEEKKMVRFLKQNALYILDYYFEGRKVKDKEKIFKNRLECLYYQSSLCSKKFANSFYWLKDLLTENALERGSASAEEKEKLMKMAKNWYEKHPIKLYKKEKNMIRFYYIEPYFYLLTSQEKEELKQPLEEELKKRYDYVLKKKKIGTYRNKDVHEELTYLKKELTKYQEHFN